MAGPLLETTHEADLQPLVANGLAVFQTLGQIRAELRKSLGDEYALLFAEPNPDLNSRDIQWYSPVRGTATRLKDAPETEREAAREKVAQLVTGISDHAQALRNSTNHNNRLMGNSLDLAIEIPSEDHIFIVGGAPVLAGWGHVPRGPAAPRQLLQKLASQRRQKAAVPDVGAKSPPPIAQAAFPQQGDRYRLEVSRAAVSSVPVVAGASRWPAALLWLLFTALLLAIGYLLLKNCALGWPGAEGLHRTIFNFCEAPAVAATPPVNPERNRNLLNELAQLDKTLLERRNQCVVEKKEPPPDPKERDAKKDVEDAGGKIGAVNVILSWENSDDLDIYVKCPDGSEISFSKKTACKATLDVDANVGGSTMARPVENVTWPAGAAPEGEFVVEVERFSARNPGSTSFTVELLINGKRVDTYRGSLAREKDKQRSITFRLPYRGAR